MKRGEDEDCGLPHPTLGLADDIHADHGLRDALVLDLGRVLEAAVHDGAAELGLEDEVPEARGVDADIATLLDLCSAGERRAEKRVSGVGKKERDEK